MLEDERSRRVFQAMKRTNSSLLLRNSQIRDVEQKINTNPDAILKVAQHKEMRQYFTEEFYKMVNKTGEEY